VLLLLLDCCAVCFGTVVVVRLVVLRRDVQQPQDGLDAPRQEGGGVYCGEEARCARVHRVLYVQAELGEGEGVVVAIVAAT
jgi:hypothetical protein